MRFDLDVRLGPKMMARLEGIKAKDAGDLTMQSVKQVIALEAQLEELIGYRFHIIPKEAEAVSAARLLIDDAPDMVCPSCGSKHFCSQKVKPEAEREFERRQRRI